MLSEEEIWALYGLYEADFNLFGYEVEPSLLIRIHSTTAGGDKYLPQQETQTRRKWSG